MDRETSPVFQKNVISLNTSLAPSKEDSEFQKVKKVHKINLDPLVKKAGSSTHDMVHNYLLHLQKQTTQKADRIPKTKISQIRPSSAARLPKAEDY